MQKSNLEARAANAPTARAVAQPAASIPRLQLPKRGDRLATAIFK